MGGLVSSRTSRTRASRTAPPLNAAESHRPPVQLKATSGGSFFVTQCELKSDEEATYAAHSQVYARSAASGSQRFSVRRASVNTTVTSVPASAGASHHAWASKLSSPAITSVDVEADTDNPKVTALARGGRVVKTSAGPIQFGLPPETIKDSLQLGLEVPSIFIVFGNLFHRRFDSPSPGILPPHSLGDNCQSGVNQNHLPEKSPQKCHFECASLWGSHICSFAPQK